MMLDTDSICPGEGFSKSGKEGKAFFSEEKKQKTFGPAVAESPSARAQGNKSFLVLFFKKELLACLPPVEVYADCLRVFRTK